MEIPDELSKLASLIRSGTPIKRKAELRPHQPALTVAEQVENLKSVGLEVEDEARAQKILNEVSYFRLVKAYGVGLKPKNGEYASGVTLNKLLALYNFDSKMRQILLAGIERVEVALRCRVANYFCVKYGVLGYDTNKNFADARRYSNIMDEIEKALIYNARSPFVRNFRENYERQMVPFYALVEIMSFGTMSKFFKNMKPEDKKVVAKAYGHNWPYLESWFESLAYVRNICAHYGRLYNVRLDKTPKLSKELKAAGVSNIRIFGAISCLARLLPENDVEELVVRLEEIISQYPEAELEKIGFISGWQGVLRGAM